jgi:hypothetical protein
MHENIPPCLSLLHQVVVHNDCCMEAGQLSSGEEEVDENEDGAEAQTKDLHMGLVLVDSVVGCMHHLRN